MNTTQQFLWGNPISLNRQLLIFLLGLSALILVACQPSGAANERLRPLDFTPFETALIEAGLAEVDSARLNELDAQIATATIPELQTLMKSGDLSATELTLYYLARIQKYDGGLNSVMELNPDALVIAADLDAEAAAGEIRGPLHGIPIMLKDNIATGDQMHNTAGAVALVDHRAPRDSFVAQQLRDAGAILLGKTNLSEWAYFMSNGAPSGFSALGGQVINPYGEDLEVYGSSTGSAVAASARFAAATVGTETTGSIIAPAAANGVAGMRPTFGLVSQDLIIPITAQLDSAGPIAASVTDLAVLLTVMAAEDPNDPFAEMADGIHGTDFAATLGKISLDGLRVGLPVLDPSEAEALNSRLAAAISALEEAGATIVPVTIPIDDAVNALFENHLILLAGSMAADVNHYLAASESWVDSLSEVIDFNEAELDVRAPFGQDLLEMARDSAMLPQAHEALGNQSRATAQTVIRQAAADDELDVILSVDNEFSLLYAVAGFPAITVPMGVGEDGQPHGATFVGVDAGTDAALLAIAYAFEQASLLRVEPRLER